MKPQVAELLFEVGCEEIPAGMIAGAANQLKVILNKYLTAESLLTDGALETFGAPRRLATVCTGLRLRQEDIKREVTGPPKSVAFDSAGIPTRAAESFAAKQGVAVASLGIIATPRGEYVCARQVIPGRTAEECLKEILPRAVTDLQWPRTMYWTGPAGLRFIRPIRWVVALLGGKHLPFQVAGITAGAFTEGHRFLGRSRIRVTGPQDYFAKLRSNFVMARAEERRTKVEVDLATLTGGSGLCVNPDAKLSELVVYLNEYPTAILGNFDKSYLALPEEILITVMRDHQKYFAVRGQDGNLAPHFLAVINLDADTKGLIRAGHERVLRARFADANFFWHADQKCRLADNLPKLAHVTFQAQLGNYAEKIERVRSLARWLAEQWVARGIQEANVAEADRAAELAKCDLVSDMVREFPELEGIVGGLYAKVQGEHEEVAWAVYDHYRPAAVGDSIPRNFTGCTVAIADKLDTLVGCFAVGLMPTGSSDPFALRRAAMGIVKIILDRKLPLSLADAVAAAAKGIAESAPRIAVTPETEKQVLQFLVERARHIFVERDGFAYDEVNAAFAADADDLVDAAARISAVRTIRTTQDFDPLAISFKRIRKILEKAGPRDGWARVSVRPDLFQEDAERNLHAAAGRVAQHAEQHKRAGRYADALQSIASLRPEVDEFFDHVMVMAQEEDVRNNRLTLLAELLGEFSTIADFSELSPAQNV